MRFLQALLLPLLLTYCCNAEDNATALDDVTSGFWYGPFVNSFGDWQCEFIDKIGHETLDECKDLCDRLIGCNALNYKSSTDDCVLRGCPTPIPNPADTDFIPDYYAYARDE